MTHHNVDFSKQIETDIDNSFNVRDELKSLTVEELQAVHLRDRLPFGVCALNTTGDLNLGVMLRTASILGASDFIIFGRRKYDRRSSVGAQNYIKVHRVDGLNADMSFNLYTFWETMTALNYFPVFVEQLPIELRALGVYGPTLQTISWPKIIERYGQGHHPCLVFGNESTGIPLTLISSGHPIVEIPQRGVLRSLNVSASMAMVTWDLVKYLTTNNK